jgi:GNAT superfamily N-acetyltransferase
VELDVQRYLRRSAARGRDVEHIGPFLATFDRGTDHPYLSYAIPEDGARPAPEEVQALIAAYRARRRVPRLEYLPAAAPDAEAALLAGGFAVELRTPVMTCAAEEAVALAPPEGVELVLPRAEAELAAGGAVANAAFGEPPTSSPEQVMRTRELLAAGGIAVLARDAAGGEALGWGVCTPPRDGVTELAGIGVAEAHRRRGIAGAIVARLAAEAFGRGVRTAFLTPGDEGAGRVYARAGFAPRGEMLHLRI